jgi:uncharacterized protein YndB with AHSA1/START domain
MSVEPIAPYLEPLRKSVTVALAPTDAFALFTDKIASWWPLHKYSIGAERATSCVVEPRVGGGVYEIRNDGERFPWGEILAWDPPHRFVMTWHPGREPETGQEVEVRFLAAGAGSRVELEHRGWQTLGAAAAETREGYASGWDDVLDAHFRTAAEKGA